MAVNWKKDHDGSWCVTDRDGGFYRVHSAVTPAPECDWFWITAWTESNGLRLGTGIHKTAEAAKAAMENIMPTEDEVAA